MQNLNIGLNLFLIHNLGTGWVKKLKIFFNSKNVDNDFICRGQIEEDNAPNNYELKTDSTVFETSVIVSNINKWISYSPDGIVMKNNFPNKLLEIKCPYLGN